MYRKIFLSLILTAYLFNSMGSTKTSNRPKEKNILIIYTYSATNTAYKIIQSGIVEQLNKKYGDNYNLHLEYLEADRFTDDASIKQHIDLLNEKYPSINPDLLICVGVDGVRLLKQYCNPFLLSLPNINYDFDLSRYGIQLETHLNSKTVYMGLDFDIALTIKNALEIFPKTDTVYFITGSASNDFPYRSITELTIQKEFPNLHLIPLYDLSMEELLIKVSKIPNNHLIFFASYNGDGKGVPFYNNDAIKLIRIASKAPIIGYSDLGFSIGILGGKILSFKESGLITGDAAVKILEGVDPNTIELKKDDYYSYQFDWRELQRLNINEETIFPKGYQICCKEQNFIEEYKWIILSILLFLWIETFLIISLVVLVRKQRIMIRTISETENKLREFANEDRILRIGQLSASLSHELIQPLTAILSTAQAGIRFIESNKCSPKFMKELFNNIIEDEKRTTSILRSIMGMMKLEERKKEKTELNSLIEDVVSIYQSEAINNNVKIVLNLSRSNIFILADRVQIQQVILNLLLNATQAMEKTIDNKKFISINIVPELDRVKIKICDNGTGIDSCIMNNLFKPFLSTKEKGLGIGLSICKNIIDMHDGKIHAENLPDSGAEFEITLNTYE